MPTMMPDVSAVMSASISSAEYRSTYATIQDPSASVWITRECSCLPIIAATTMMSPLMRFRGFGLIATTVIWPIVAV